MLSLHWQLTVRRVNPRRLKQRDFPLALPDVRRQRSENTGAQRWAQVLVLRAHRVRHPQRRRNVELLRRHDALDSLTCGERVGDDLLHARRRQRVAQPLSQLPQRLGERRWHLPAQALRWDLVVPDDARHLLHHIVRDTDIRAPVGHAHLVALRRQPATAEAQPCQRASHLRCRQVNAQHLEQPLAGKLDLHLRRRIRIDIDESVQRLASCQLHQQLRRAPGGDHRQLRAQPLLEPRRRLRARLQFRRRPPDVRRMEGGRFQQHRRRRLRHLRLEPAHHAGQRDRRLRIRDSEHIGRKLLFVAVDHHHLLALPGASHDDLASAQLLEIESVQRLAQLQHHVVRDIDDDVDRAHPAGDKPLLHPARRFSHPHVLDQRGDVAIAQVRVGDLHRRPRRCRFV